MTTYGKGSEHFFININTQLKRMFYVTRMFMFESSFT